MSNMIFKILFGVYVLCVQYIEVRCEACKDKEYSFNETICLECPDNCTACLSDKTCTSCNDGFYGIVCNILCPQNCSSGGCHQQYGHCTYGCDDGQFASDDRATCLSCPENCGVCRNCATCVNNSYITACSLTCPDTCAGGICNQSTGHCLQCKHGYHWHDGRCLQCPGECISCANVTHCIECHNMYLGPFQGKCFRKCYTKPNIAVSKPNQRCGFSHETTQEKQPSCFKIQVGRRYSCTSKEFCIDCAATWNNCSNITAEDDMCVRHERCSIKCEPERQSQTMKRQAAAADHAFCKQTCANDRNTQQSCLMTTASITTSSFQEHIECSQELEVIANSPEGFSTLTTVAVVFGCLVVLLLIWRVMYEHKQSCTMSTRRSRSTEVAQQLESVQRFCDLPSEFQNTTTFHRSSTVENVYDRATFVTEHRINKDIPSYHRCIQENVYDTANCSHFITGDRMNIMLPSSTYPRESLDTVHGTANCCYLNKGDRMNTMLPAPPYPREIQDTLNNTTNVSQLVTDARESKPDCFPTQCQYIPGDSYNTVNPGPDARMNNTPLAGSDVDDIYDCLVINRSATGGPIYTEIADIPLNLDDG